MGKNTNKYAYRREKPLTRTQEKELLLKIIASLNNSKKIKTMFRKMDQEARKEGHVFEYRIKSAESAVKKFEDKGYQKASRMGDLIRNDVYSRRF